MSVVACPDFLATARDRDRCHICLQPKHVHPTDYDGPYWANWLVFFVLLELVHREPPQKDNALEA